MSILMFPIYFFNVKFFASNNRTLLLKNPLQRFMKQLYGNNIMSPILQRKIITQCLLTQVKPLALELH